MAGGGLIKYHRHFIFSIAYLCFGSICSYAGQLAHPPDIRTEAECKRYLGDVSELSSGYYEKRTACMRQPTNFGYGDECSLTKNGWVVRRNSYQAWSQCGAWEEWKCDLEKQRQDAYACLDSAYKQKKEQAESLNNGIKRYRNIESQFNEAERLINSPYNFFEKKLSKYLVGEYKRIVNPDRQELTEVGKKQMEETYSFLLDKTLSSSAWKSKNPIISAIQGAAANELRDSIYYQVAQMERASKLISDFNASKSGTNTGSKSRPASIYGGECSVLDRDERTDLAIDNPDHYEYLVRKCGRH